MCDLGLQTGIEPLHQEPVVLATGHQGSPLKAVLKDALAMTHMIFQNDRSLFFFSTSSLSYFSMKVKNPTSPIPIRNAQYIIRFFRDIALII